MSLIKVNAPAKDSAAMDYEPFPKNSYVKYKGKPYIVVEEAATLKRMGNSYGLKRLDERGNIVGGMIDAPKSQIEELKGWDSAEAKDGLSEMSRHHDSISKAVLAIENCGQSYDLPKEVNDKIKLSARYIKEALKELEKYVHSRKWY